MDGEKNKMKVRAIKEKREKEKIGQVGQQEKKGSQNDVTLKKKKKKRGRTMDEGRVKWLVGRTEEEDVMSDEGREQEVKERRKEKVIHFEEGKKV